MAVSLSSCITYEDVEVKDVGNIQYDNLLNPGEDKKVSVELVVYNPNSYNIKIKKADLDVYVAGKKVGRIDSDKAFLIRKESETTHELVILIDSGSVLKAAMSGGLKALTSGKVDVRIKGRVKGKAFGVGKWFDVDHKEEVDVKGKLFLPKG